MTDKMTNQEAIDRLKLIRSPYMEVAVDMAIDALQAEPLKHGEWVYKEREYNDCDGHYTHYWHECSVCGARPPKDTWKNEWRSDYCPSCGARMYKEGVTE